jgi:hypothetical protein
MLDRSAGERSQEAKMSSVELEDHGAGVALAMADATAVHGELSEALWWLELANEHAGPLEAAYAAKRREWIRSVRMGDADARPRKRVRRTELELPYA